jgi:hypothetical protein
VPGAAATPYQKSAPSTFDAGEGRAKLVPIRRPARGWSRLNTPSAQDRFFP